MLDSQGMLYYYSNKERSGREKRPQNTGGRQRGRGLWWLAARQALPLAAASCLSSAGLLNAPACLECWLFAIGPNAPTSPG